MLESAFNAKTLLKLQIYKAKISNGISMMVKLAVALIFYHIIWFCSQAQEF